jgi:hypothetical protein
VTEFAALVGEVAMTDEPKQADALYKRAAQLGYQIEPITEGNLKSPTPDRRVAKLRPTRAARIGLMAQQGTNATFEIICPPLIQIRASPRSRLAH